MDFSWPAPEPATDYAGAPQHNNLLLRQMFLRSYQFTVRESFKGQVCRNLKEAGEVGKAIVAEIVGQVLEVGWKLRKMNPLRCFRPYHKNYLEDT